MTATLAELYNIRFNKDQLQNRTASALLKQAWTITTEDPATANHPNRRAWAEHIIETDLTQAAYEAMGWVAKSNQIQNNGAAATDNQIENAVAEAMPNLVDPLIPARPDLTDVAEPVVTYIIAIETAFRLYP